MKFSIPDHDKPCANRVRDGGIWEQETVEYIASFDGVKVHAGAYFGDFLPYIDAEWAFEPIPENFFHARETIRLNGLKTRLLPVALGDRNSAVPMKSDGGQSVISDQWDVIVPMMRLDDLIKQVDLIHLDIEGCEQLAVNGARRLIREHSPVVISERDIFIPGYEQTGFLNNNRIYHPCSSEKERPRKRSRLRKR